MTVSSLRLERASRRARLRVDLAGAISFVQCTNSGAIGDTADMPQARRGRGADANDPNRTKPLCKLSAFALTAVIVLRRCGRQ
jgi:hypothetical protein